MSEKKWFIVLGIIAISVLIITFGQFWVLQKSKSNNLYVNWCLYPDTKDVGVHLRNELGFQINVTRIELIYIPTDDSLLWVVL